MAAAEGEAAAPAAGAKPGATPAAAKPEPTKESWRAPRRIALQPERCSSLAFHVVELTPPWFAFQGQRELVISDPRDQLAFA